MIKVPKEQLTEIREHGVRDLWRQKELGKFSDEFSMTVAPHGAEMLKIK